MSAPEYVDRQAEDDATWAAELARLDRLEVADEDTVERVARAMCEADFATYGFVWWTCGDGQQDEYRRLAHASIAALKPAPGTDSSGQQ